MVSQLRTRALKGLALLLAICLAGCAGPVPQGADRSAPATILTGRTVTPDLCSISAVTPRQDPPPAGPVEWQTLPLGLRDALTLALAGHHDIRVAGWGPAQARAEIRAAEADYDPVLFGEGAIQNRGGTTTSGFYEREEERSARVGVRQKLATGAVLSVEESISEETTATPSSRGSAATGGPAVELTQPLLRGLANRPTRVAIAIARINAETTLEEFRRVAQDAVVETIDAYWALVQARTEETIAAQVLARADEVCQREAVRLDRGLSKQLDVSRAVATRAARRNDLLRARRGVQVAEDQLKLQLNAPRFAVEEKVHIEPADRLTTSPCVVHEAVAVEQALARRPEVLAARHGAARSAQELGLARHELLPRLDLKARYSAAGDGTSSSSAWNDQGLDRDDNWEVGVALEVPLGNQAARAEVDKRVAAHRQAEEALVREEKRAVNEVRVAVHSLELAVEEIPAAREAVEAARTALEGEEARFELGETSNEELLRAQEFLASAERTHLQVLVDYNRALVQFARAKGTLLDDLAVSIDQKR